MEDQLFTWEALTAMGGASLLTFLVVLHTKTLLPKKVPVELYSVAVAWLILVLAQIALGASPLDWRIYVLALANGFLVSMSAGHMNDKAKKPPGSNGDVR